jgi:thymidine kinase
MTKESLPTDVPACMKKKIQPIKGRLTVIAGPMFSGKTGKLVAMVDVFTRMGHKVLTVKPKLDNRYGGLEEIHSHDHKKTAAIVVDGETAESIIDRILVSGADKVIFDEVQFFDKKKVMRVIEALRSRSIHVIAAGLLYDYQRKPFGSTPDLLGLADERLELFAICQKCGGLARHTERVGGGKGQIVVGAANMYIASCERCHRIYR